MPNIGNRIFYDQDGDIIYQTGEASRDVIPRKEITSINYIDLDYGELDITKYRITGIDVNSLVPILEELPVFESEEQRRIRELEDALLLQADNELGGIL